MNQLLQYKKSLTGSVQALFRALSYNGRLDRLKVLASHVSHLYTVVSGCLFCLYSYFVLLCVYIFAGTTEQCEIVMEHLEKIIKKKYKMLLKPNENRNRPV